MKLVADITLANKEGFDAHLAKKLIPCGIGKKEFSVCLEKYAM